MPEIKGSDSHEELETFFGMLEALEDEITSENIQKVFDYLLGKVDLLVGEKQANVAERSQADAKEVDLEEKGKAIDALLGLLLATLKDLIRETGEQALREAGVFENIRRALSDVQAHFNQAKMDEIQALLAGMSVASAESLDTLCEGEGAAQLGLPALRRTSETLRAKFAATKSTSSSDVWVGCFGSSPAPRLAARPRRKGLQPGQANQPTDPIPKNETSFFAGPGSQENGSAAGNPHGVFAQQGEQSDRAENIEGKTDRFGPTGKSG